MEDTTLTPARLHLIVRVRDLSIEAEGKEPVAFDSMVALRSHLDSLTTIALENVGIWGGLGGIAVSYVP